MYHMAERTGPANPLLCLPLSTPDMDRLLTVTLYHDGAAFSCWTATTGQTISYRSAVGFTIMHWRRAPGTATRATFTEPMLPIWNNNSHASTCTSSTT